MSHAYSYGHLTYYTAWLKANYPLEFYTSIISNEEDAKQQAFYMEDARRRGINVLPPNVNESDTGFAISSYDDIVYGFSGIKGIGASVYNDLKSLRPFSSIGDFLLRTYMSKSRINKKAYDALIRSGALDTFGYKRSIMIRSYEKFILDFDPDNKIKKAFIASGYVMTAEIKEQIRSHIKNESLYFSDDAMSEYTLLEILEMEKELLGIYITGDPFDVVLKAVKERHFLATDAEIAVGEKGSFSGMIVAKITGNRGIKTKTGKDMCFLSAEDHKGNSFSMTAFDNVYSKSKLIMRNGNYLACYVNAKPSYKNDGTIDYVISSVIDLSEDMKKVSKDMDKFAKTELEISYTPNGRLSSSTILQYNNKMASLMNDKVSGIQAPSGRVLKFVAKRGEIGVHTAIADSGYDLNQLQKGVFKSGKVAYKKENLIRGGD